MVSGILCRIPTAVHYPVPLHLQPVFAGLGFWKDSFPVSEAAVDRVMSLPMHPYLKEESPKAITTTVLSSVIYGS